MAIRVGINGFGRIGRQVVRAAKMQGVADLDFVAVNDLTDTKTLAHLFKYDSVHRTYQGDVSPGDGSISIDGDDMKVLAGIIVAKPAFVGSVKMCDRLSHFMCKRHHEFVGLPHVAQIEKALQDDLCGGKAFFREVGSSLLFQLAEDVFNFRPGIF